MAAALHQPPRLRGLHLPPQRRRRRAALARADGAVRPRIAGQARGRRVAGQRPADGAAASAAALGDVKLVTVTLLDAGADDDDPRRRTRTASSAAPVRPGKRARTPREWAECFGQSQVVDLLDRRAGGASPEKKKRRREAKCFCLPACPFYGANTGEMVNCETARGSSAIDASLKVNSRATVRDESALECARAARQATERRIVETRAEPCGTPSGPGGPPAADGHRAARVAAGHPQAARSSSGEVLQSPGAARVVEDVVGIISLFHFQHRDRAVCADRAGISWPRPR